MPARADQDQSVTEEEALAWHQAWRLATDDDRRRADTDDVGEGVSPLRADGTAP